MSTESDRDTDSDSKPAEEHHQPGAGHAHHRFDPDHAKKFHDPDRLERMRINPLLERVDVRDGTTVLDLGTCSGALLPACSRAVGPSGRVIGLDISNEMLNQAQTVLERESHFNVTLHQNKPGTIPCDDKSIDRALIISSLHEFADPSAMLAELDRILVSDGRVGILEWRYDDTEHGPPLDHRQRPQTITDWLNKVGLTPTSHEAWSGGYDLYLANKE